MPKLKLVLASNSPRRKELLGHLQVPFQVLSLNVPEESSSKDPVEFSSKIARDKGEAVFQKLRKENPDQGLFVVSADTIVCLGDRIYEKPRDRQEARLFLSELSGKTHVVFTAVSVRVSLAGEVSGFAFVEETQVTFNDIAEELMENYLNTGDSLDKAGAYGIQGPSLTFISRVEGDYANVVGFPLSRFVGETRQFLKNKFNSEASWLSAFRS